MKLEQHPHTLICVKHGHNGLRFINRAIEQIDDARRTTIFLFGNMACEENHEQRIVGMSLFKKLAAKHSANLIISEGRSPTTAKMIAETAREIEATQIIVGQYVERLWRKWMRKSTVDHLIQELPSADIRVIPRTHAHEDEEWTYEKGVDAYLHPKTDGTYWLDFHKSKNTSHEGIFFRHQYTDFNNGRFAFYDEHSISEAPVRKGIIHELTDHFEQQA